MAENTPEEKSVTINGLNLLYLDWGNEGQMPLLCLHGHGSQAHVFDEFGEAMSPYYRVLALNQRGHGGSGWAPDGYARDRFVEDLSAFVDDLELNQFVLVGLSMGGPIGLCFNPATLAPIPKFSVNPCSFPLENI